MHEHFDTLVELDWHPSRRTLRSFGLIAAALAIGASWLWLDDRANNSTVRDACWSAAGLCGAVALFRPEFIRPLYLLVTCATFPVRWLVAWASLMILFFVVLTPIALAVRRLRTPSILGRSPSGSAWVPARKRPDKARYFRQS